MTARRPSRLASLFPVLLAAAVAFAVIVCASALWILMTSEGQDRVVDVFFLIVFGALLCYAVAFGSSRWIGFELERQDLDPARREWLSAWFLRLERSYRSLWFVIVLGIALTVLWSIVH